MPVDLHPKMMIRDVHLADRPRERLVRQGAPSLSNQELIAILLGTGTRNESVLVLANRVLSSFDRIQDLKEATIEEYTSVKGIGQAKATVLLAATELGKRLYQQYTEERYTIRSPEDAAAYLMTDMTSLKQEHFVVLFMNVKNEVLHKQTIFIGSFDGCRGVNGHRSIRSCHHRGSSFYKLKRKRVHVTLPLSSPIRYNMV